jgi:hypothetical protein
MRRISSQFSSILERLNDALDQGIEGAVVCVVVGDIKPAVGQIAAARRKPEAQQAAEPEYVLGRAAGIGIVLSDDEGAVCRNDLGVERRKAVGDVDVEFCAWLRPVVGVVIGASFAVAAGREDLPSDEEVSRSPQRAKRLSMDRIDLGKPERLGRSHRGGAIRQSRGAEYG